MYQSQYKLLSHNKYPLCFLSSNKIHQLLQTNFWNMLTIGPAQKEISWVNAAIQSYENINQVQSLFAQVAGSWFCRWRVLFHGMIGLFPRIRNIASTPNLGESEISWMFKLFPLKGSAKSEFSSLHHSNYVQSFTRWNLLLAWVVLDTLNK